MNTKAKLTRRIIVRIDDDNYELLTSICSRHRMSQSDIVRAALVEKAQDWATNGLRLSPSRKLRTAGAR